FYYVDPLRVQAGATIENTSPFHYCKFRYAVFGMLRIDNDQDLLLQNVEFLGPATGYNVYKSVDSGNLEFKDYYGDYAGEAYENDPYNRIHWTNNAFSLDVKVYLEGPFNGSLMTTTLNPVMLPLTQPYNQAPWNYSGSESVTAIPNSTVVDWVLIELRDAPDAASATGATVLARRAGFLHNNGTVTGTDGTSLMQFTETITNQLLVVVRHRNHISIMSGDYLQNNAGICSWDFTSGINQAYGGGNAHKQIAPGIWGMTGADGNADNQINNGDKNDVWAGQAGSGGYKSGDFNLDAQVNNGDKNDIWVPNTGLGGQVPDNGGYKCCVPE
ncbi:MAG: hypothetical protein JXA03_12655, partial [Bacteroidales bacterium]|nr:hypothetical protein [Bacteroidales bacterium]